MKLISEHLGEIIVALVGVALLIGAVVVFEDPLKNFFTNILNTLQGLGNNVLGEFADIDFSNVAG